LSERDVFLLMSTLFNYLEYPRIDQNPLLKLPEAAKLPGEGDKKTGANTATSSDQWAYFGGK
jgi:hypothetical protein